MCPEDMTIAMKKMILLQEVVYLPEWETVPAGISDQPLTACITASGIAGAKYAYNTALPEEDMAICASSGWYRMMTNCP